MYQFSKISLTVLLLAGCSLLTWSTLSIPAPLTEHTNDYGSLSYPATANGILSQCGERFTFTPESDWYGAIPDEYNKQFVPTHPMAVPVFGFMQNKPFDVEKALAVGYNKNPYNSADINRALWEGNIIIWYAPDSPKETFDYLYNFSTEWNKTHESKVIPLLWNQNVTIKEKDKVTGKDIDVTKVREMPANRKIGFSSWGASQTCSTFSNETFDDFMSIVEKTDMPRDKKNPPLAKMTDGNLTTIRIDAK